MRKRLTKSALAVLLALYMAAALLAGCGNITNEETQEGGKATALEIAGPGRALTAGEELFLLWEFLPAGSAHERIVWQVSDTKVATVGDNGSITARRPGSFTVTGTTESGLSDSVELTVTAPDREVLALVSPEKLILEVGETYQLEWYCFPESAASSVVWEYAPPMPQYATVDANGLVKAQQTGATVITGTCNFDTGPQKVTVAVEVKTAAQLAGFQDQVIRPGDTLEFRYPSTDRLSHGAIGETSTEYEPPDVNKTEKDGATTASITFRSSGTYVIHTVDGERRRTNQCEILVTEASLPETVHIKAGETADLLDTASLTEGEQRTLRLATANDKIAFVRADVFGDLADSGYDFKRNGRVYGVKKGTTVVELRALNTNPVTVIDTCTVTVTEGEVDLLFSVQGYLAGLAGDHAVINFTANQHCDFNVRLLAGRYESHSDAYVAPYLQRKVLPDSNAGSVTFDGLSPGKDYTVIVEGETWTNSNETFVHFTTPPIESPTVSAALESVTADSAAVGVTASEHCTLNAFLCAGTPAAPEGYTVPGALQKKQLSNSAGGSFSFGGLAPDSDYTVFYYGVNSAGMSSQLRRVNFTTAKPAVATLSISLEATLEAVTDLSASVSIKAGAPCGFTAYLYPGGTELPAASGGVRPGSLQKRTFSNVAEGAVTFAGLEPDTAYTVYVDSTGILGISGSTKRLDFTTELPYSKPGNVSGWIEVNAHVPVTNITGIPTKLTVGRTVTLNPTVIPTNATKKTVVWSIADDPSGSVTLEGSRLTGAAPTGEKPVTLRATIAGGGESGGSFTKDFAITVVSSGAPEPGPGPDPEPGPGPDPEPGPGPDPEPAALVLIEPSGLTVSGSNALPGGTVNTAYSLDFEAAGGKGKPYAIALQAGSLPKGLTLTAASDTTAKLSGTLSEAGRYPFTLRVTDSGGGFTDYAFTLEVAEAEPDFVPVTGISGLPTYMIQGKTIKLSGTVAPSNATKQDIIWESRDGAGHYYTLSGDQLTSTGGTGTAKLRARIKGGSGDGKDYTQDFEVEIVYPVTLSEPSQPTLNPTKAGEHYSVRFHAMNGCGEGYVFTVVNSELPAGLELRKKSDDTATLSGKPTAAGNYEFTIRVTDRDGNFEDFPFTLKVADPTATD